MLIAHLRHVYRRDVAGDEQATDTSGQTYFSDASCNEGWEDASHHSSVAGSDMFESAVEVSKCAPGNQHSLAQQMRLSATLLMLRFVSVILQALLVHASSLWEHVSERLTGLPAGSWTKTKKSASRFLHRGRVSRWACVAQMLLGDFSSVMVLCRCLPVTPSYTIPRHLVCS